MNEMMNFLRKAGVIAAWVAVALVGFAAGWGFAYLFRLITGVDLGPTTGIFGMLGSFLVFRYIIDSYHKREREKWIKIKDGYSYTRDRLTSHLEMPSGAEKTLEILDDIVRVISETISGQNRIIAAWDVGELTQHLSDAKSQGLDRVKVAERELKMMRPILAGLKKFVLISDCGVDEKEIPDDVEKILKIKGPYEVEEVVKYLSSVGLA